jgi:hypothetical protein
MASRVGTTGQGTRQPSLAEAVVGCHTGGTNGQDGCECRQALCGRSGNTAVRDVWRTLSGSTTRLGDNEGRGGDYVNFIIADFEGTYHAILGQPALAKFMAIPHYVYLLRKMPTEKGVLSLRGNVLIAYNCEKKGYATVEALELSIRMQQSIADANKIPPADLEILGKEATRAAMKSKETKEVELVPGDKSKMARIGASLDPK